MRNNRNKTNQKNYKRVQTIIRDGLTNISANVLFKREDGSSQTINLKKQSLLTENNKRITAKGYMNNLNGIKHDINAKEYIVNIIK